MRDEPVRWSRIRIRYLHSARLAEAARVEVNRHLSLGGDAQNLAIHEINRPRHQRVRARRVDLLFWSTIPRCAVQDALPIRGELCPVNRAALERELVEMGREPWRVIPCRVISAGQS